MAKRVHFHRDGSSCERYLVPQVNIFNKNFIFKRTLTMLPSQPNNLFKQSTFNTVAGC